MATIDDKRDILTLINVVEVEPANADAVIAMFVNGTETIISKLDGFISSSIHRSLDGTRVINYAQWRDVAALEAARNNPDLHSSYQLMDELAKSYSPMLTKVVQSTTV